MTKEHKISWLNMPGYQPETWNPIIGCSKVTPGCDNCYAERMAIRLAGMPNKQLASDYKYTMFPGADNKPSGWNGHTLFRAEYLLHPERWKTPRMVFVCSMSDLFHEQTSFETIEKVYDVMYSNKQHIFVILTKRPERAYKFWAWLLDKVAGAGIQDVSVNTSGNIWFGVTAENQEQANKRIPILLSIPHAKRFVSIEPMLGPVDLTNILTMGFFPNVIGYQFKTGEKFEGPKLDWVICGGESGSKARPMHPDWVRFLRDQCRLADVPFFFKQWGEWKPFEEGDKCKTLHTWLHDSEINIKIVTKVGRNAAGDLIDGEHHHNWPNDQVKCKIGSEACVYHACMDDGCQKQHMIKVHNYGLGDCEKPEKINL